MQYLIWLQYEGKNMGMSMINQVLVFFNYHDSR